MMKRWTAILICFVLTASCGQNPLGELNTGSSAAALLEQMKIDLDNGDYDEGYSVAQNLIGRYPGNATSDDFKRTYGGILAGQCGFIFTTFVSNLGSAAGATLFLKLKNAFSTVTVNVSKCTLALSTMNSLSNPTSSDRLNKLILHLANIGIILKASSVAPGLDTCTITSPIAANEISSTNIKLLVASFGSVIQNANDIASSISGGVGGLDALTAVCNPGAGASAEEIALANILNPICSSTDASTVTAQSAATFRRLLADSTIGVGSCDIGNDMAIVRDGNNDGDINDAVGTDLVDLNNLMVQSNYSCCPGLKYNLGTEDTVEESLVSPPGTADVPLTLGASD